jgi:hypothetical protein
MDLQDAFTDSWCSRMNRSIINTGNPLFYALEKGLKSNIRKVSRACLTAIAWLGCEITKSPDSLRYSACEILLSGIEQFLHPGLELEDRLLACLCIYNYASGKGNAITIKYIYVITTLQYHKTKEIEPCYICESFLWYPLQWL